MEKKQQPDAGFSGLGIAPRILDILGKHKFTMPTPIQRESIPVGVEGKDLIGIAQTGTGKTLAFGIPMIQRLASGNSQGLVLVPTRELALQVDESLQRIGKPMGLRTAVLIGGTSIDAQHKLIRKNPHVIVATPGRLIDHLNRRSTDLRDVRILVLDEADRMLDMGFAPQINKILEVVPKNRQTLLFSATMPSDIVKIAERHMRMPVRVEIARPGTASENVTQEMFIVKKDDKYRLLESMLLEHEGTALVFARTRHGASKVCKVVRSMGHTAAEIHSDRSLNQRKEALQGFKTGKYRILVATDIAARGIDVTGIGLVVNYDLPDAAEDYVHRIGRTGRAGMKGRAVSFVLPDQKFKVRIVEKLIGGKLAENALPQLPPARVAVHNDGDEESRHMRGGSGRFGQRSGRDRDAFHRKPHGGPRLNVLGNSRPGTDTAFGGSKTSGGNRAERRKDIARKPVKRAGRRASVHGTMFGKKPRHAKERAGGR